MSLKCLNINVKTSVAVAVAVAACEPTVTTVFDIIVLFLIKWSNE